MVTLNPIILDTLKTYIDENTDIPQELNELIERLLRCETFEVKSKEGMDKMYDQTLEKFISNITLVKWSKNYVN